MTKASKAAHTGIRKIEAEERKLDRERWAHVPHVPWPQEEMTWPKHETDAECLARCGINNMAATSEKTEEEVAIEYENKKSAWKAWSQLLGPPEPISDVPGARGEEERAEAINVNEKCMKSVSWDLLPSGSVVTPAPQRPVRKVKAPPQLAPQRPVLKVKAPPPEFPAPQRAVPTVKTPPPVLQRPEEKLAAQSPTPPTLTVKPPPPCVVAASGPAPPAPKPPSKAPPTKAPPAKAPPVWWMQIRLQTIEE